MIVFIFNIKRILNKKKRLLAMYIIPILISILATQVTFYLPKLQVGVVNLDKTRLASFFIQNLNEDYNVKIIDKTEIKGGISSSELNYAIIIDKGFEKAIMSGKEPKMKAFYDDRSDLYKMANENISAFIHKSSSVGLESNKDSKVFYSKLSSFISKNKVKLIETEINKKTCIQVTLSLFIMLMLYNAINITSDVMNDKHEKLRSFAAPITIRNYMAQVIFTLFLLELLQVTILFAALIIEYKIVIIKYILKLFLIYSVFSITAVSFAIFLNYITKRYGGGRVTSSVIVVPMCMLGGCFWNFRLEPKPFQFIAQFIPTTWVSSATNAVLNDRSYGSFGAAIGILLLFSLVFLLLGVFTKKDIVN